MSDGMKARTIRQQLFEEYRAAEVIAHECDLDAVERNDLVERLVDAVESEVATTLSEAREGEL